MWDFIVATVPELGQSKDMLEPGKTPVELAAVAQETFPAQQVC
jgi:hypothetical protein